MEDLFQFIIDKFSNLIKKDESGVKYVLRDEINEQKLSPAEKAAVRMAFEAHNIQLRDKPITKEDRPLLVEDYEYRSTDGFEELDTPEFKTVDDLEVFIVEEFIPKNVVMKINRNGKNKVNSELKAGERYPSIQWNKIQKLRLSEAENRFVLGILEREGIRVGGLTPNIDEDFENYDYITTYSSKKYPKLLTNSETKKLFNDYHSETDPDKKRDIREELIIRNARLVPYIAWSIAKYYGLEAEDVEQMGFEGLVRAVERFNPNLGYSFSTYAVQCIKGAIYRNISKELNIRYNTTTEDLSLLKRAIKLVEDSWNVQFDGNEMMLDEIIEFIADVKGTSVESLDRLRNKVRGLYKKPFEESSGKEGIEAEEYDLDYVRPVVKDVPDTDGVYYEASDTLLKECMDKVLSTLTLRERRVLELRFGLVDGQARSLPEIGRILDVSGTRIMQIEAKAIRKMRHPSRYKELIDFLEIKRGSNDRVIIEGGSGVKLS